MRNTFPDGCCKSDCKYVEILENMGAWEIFSCTSDINVLDSTWEFNIKHFTSGQINKFKDIFCAQGDWKLESVDYLETYASVV